ncbi:hypothetical protein [Acinetobacter variabilis]|uniref:hypothetical protein n=1 Tax=Acinetobacter variabilis TaxID=70346 RepID=UPI002899C678|nr:hypothetical protein [Acinetobacter variabilis]
MKMQMFSSVCFYNAVSSRIASYLIYPSDATKRNQYYSKQILEGVFDESKDINLAKIFKDHAEVMALITPLAHQYRSPNKGYILKPAFVAGHLLLAMIRMKISGIEPSLQKAYYFYLEITQKDPENWGVERVGIRQIEQAWSEFKSVAHIGLVVGKLGVTQYVDQYPVFLSSIYRVQKLYLDIISSSDYLDFEIWEMPFLDQLTWQKNSTVYSPRFIENLKRTMVFDKLNEDELNIMLKYSKTYFKRGSAK